MLKKLFAVSALAVTALAQDPDLLDLLNSTRGFSYLNENIASVPALATAIAQLNNVTILAPSDAALHLFPWDPRYEQIEAAGIDYMQNLIAYHIIEGVYENFTDSWTPYKTALRSEEYTQVTGGQVVIGRWYYRSWESEFISGLDLTAHAPTMLRFNGGVIYPIDDVLNIPGGLSKELSGELNGTSFVEALEKAGLLEEVESLKDATFLVPNDAAFEEVEQSISELSKEKLAEVLKYHVITDNVIYNNLLENGTYTTLGGSEVTVSRLRRTFFDNARAIDNNVLVSNGVAFILDQVLNPEATMEPLAWSDGSGTPAFPNGTASGSQSATATAGAVVETFTGAASTVRKGGISVAALAAAAAFAVSL